MQEQEYLSIKELFDLGGNVAIVTGAASGIGFACARRLAEAGAAIVLADINPETGEMKTRELTSNGFQATFVKCDVTKEPDIRNLVDTTVRTFGSLDILVNNAGIYPNKPMTEMDIETWDRIMNINLKGVFFLCRWAARHMIELGRGGNIINIASASASHPTVGLTAYDSSKAGVWMLTRTMAVELAPYNIRVNSVSPGPIHTEGVSSPEAVEFNKSRLHRILMQRLGRPDEMANIVLFLACRASTYITGSDIVADCGWSLT